MSSNIRVRRSVLDRLLATDAPDGLVMTQTIEQLRDSVARDLETLLNTRAPFDFEQLPGWPQVRSSVLTYGVRDFVGLVLSNSEEQRHIARSLAQAVEAHEPRLSRVRVLFAERAERGGHRGAHRAGAAQAASGSLAFTIHAWLVVHPAQESVSFDAVLQPAAARFAVTHARFSAPALLA